MKIPIQKSFVNTVPGTEFYTLTPRIKRVLKYCCREWIEEKKADPEFAAIASEIDFGLNLKKTYQILSANDVCTTQNFIELNADTWTNMKLPPSLYTKVHQRLHSVDERK